MKLLIAISLILCCSGFFIDPEKPLECARCECKDDIGAEVCLIIESGLKYSLRKCSSENKVCDLHNMTKGGALCSNYYTGSNYLPGEYCTNDAECLSNKCNKTCQGKKETESCTTHEDCDAGLYCAKGNSVCSKTKAVDEICDENKRCAWNLVCNSNNKCIHKGSKKDGDDAKSPEECESFYINGSKCAEGPKFAGKKLVSNEYKCFYEGTEKFDTPAKCGRDSEGTMQCNLGQGDVDMKPVSFELK